MLQRSLSAAADYARNHGKKIVTESRLNPEKLALIDYACNHLYIESFADLGGVWAVGGGYTFYMLKKYHIERALLVDTDFTDKVIKKQKRFSNLTLVNENFGSQVVVDKIKRVDAVILFDVLLHQVRPDWNEIIKQYSQVTNYFVIYNPQYIEDRTVRLLDLGEEEYFKTIPHTKEDESYKSAMRKMYETHPQHNRIYRDIHNIWQWGITDKDLFGVMEENGFSNIYYINYGMWGNLKKFERHAFIFRRN